MIICDYEFNETDPERPTYSLVEIDYYARIPWKAQQTIKDHRLSLRKNLLTNKYEVYRYYYYNNNRREEVIAESSDLAEAVSIAEAETRKYWDIDREDRICRHKGLMKSSRCPINE
ncbi:MAG: hypothetical protein QXO37_09265 [Candidatus Nitrosocaldaceae archaeon]